MAFSPAVQGDTDQWFQAVVQCSRVSSPFFFGLEHIPEEKCHRDTALRSKLVEGLDRDEYVCYRAESGSDKQVEGD